VSLRALEIARSAILARQTELEVISHNVANANTPGYARRRVNLVAVPSEQRTGTATSGLGVAVASIDRTGDRLLAAQIDLETAHLGRASVTYDALCEVEAAASGSDGQGLVTALNAFFDAISKMGADPSASTPRQEVLSAAENLCDHVRTMDTELRAVLARNDQLVQSTVARVNALAQQVADLNARIGESGGNEALDLIEQRDGAVRELAELCGAAAIQRPGGQVDVMVGGHPLVQGAQASAFDCETVADATPGFPAYHQVSFRGNTPPEGLGGKLAGLIQVRVSGIRQAISDLNDFIATFASAFNAQHEAGYDLNGDPGLALFTFDPTAPAQTLAVDASVAGKPSLLAAADAPGEPGNGRNATALEALRSSGTLLQNHLDYITGIANAVAVAKSQMDARQTVVDALDARYSDMTGVSPDEEALRLSAAERTYAAAQRVAQTALAILDDILRLGT
jgi:flagellar hook-associated protein 1 FlgK